MEKVVTLSAISLLFHCVITSLCMSTKGDAPQRFHTAIEYRTLIAFKKVSFDILRKINMAFAATLAKAFTQVKPS